jgi:hypothetical protein
VAAPSNVEDLKHSAARNSSEAKRQTQHQETTTMSEFVFLFRATEAALAGGCPMVEGGGAVEIHPVINCHSEEKQHAGTSRFH